MRDRRRRRARIARWTQRKTLRSLEACATLFGECSALVAEVQRELAHAPPECRDRMYEVVREMIDVEQLGRVALLATLLPPTGRHDA